MTFKRQVFLILGFIIILFFVNVVFFRTTSPINKPQLTPTPPQSFESITPGISLPEISITQTPYTKQQIKQNLISQMPVSFQEFTIEYLVTSDVFVVTIMQNPFDENKKKAEQWFHDNGIVDLKDIPIEYIKPRFVQ